MADTTFLAWPFFDEGHRALARDLEPWARDALPTTPKPPCSCTAASITCCAEVLQLIIDGKHPEAARAAGG